MKEQFMNLRNVRCPDITCMSFDIIFRFFKISDFIKNITDHTYPTAVINENGKYTGTISKSKLLKVFDKGLANG